MRFAILFVADAAVGRLQGVPRSSATVRCRRCEDLRVDVSGTGAREQSADGEDRSQRRHRVDLRQGREARAAQRAGDARAAGQPLAARGRRGKCCTTRSGAGAPVSSRHPDDPDRRARAGPRVRSRSPPGGRARPSSSTFGSARAAIAWTSRTMSTGNRTNSLLKASFPLAAANPKATYDLGVGTIDRTNNEPDKYEVPAQKWADMTDASGTFGVGIINDSKHGWDKPSDNTLRLTLHPHAAAGRRLHLPEQQRSRTASLPVSRSPGTQGDWRQGQMPARAHG